MINKFKKIIFAVLMVLLFINLNPASVFAAEYTYGDWKFQLLSDGSAEITGYTGSSTSVTIPSKVVKDGKYISVVSIGREALYDGSCRNIIKITIPEGIQNLDYYCLGGINATEITIPASVDHIDSSALPKENLIKLVVASSNPVYDSRNNCNAVIETSSDTLVIGCPNTTIPSSVKVIGSYAFSSVDLPAINLPNGVTTINNYAFRYCRAKSIYIPASVTSIATTGFDECRYLENITVDPKNTVYDSRNDCNAIMITSYNKLLKGAANTVIPADTNSIGDNAFKGNTLIKSITIPSGVTQIGYYSFTSMSNCVSIFVPNSVTTIQPYNFRNMKNSEFKLICLPGSDAEKYALANSIECETYPEITIKAPDDIKPGDDLVKKSTETMIKYNGIECKMLLVAVSDEDGTIFYNMYSEETGWIVPSIAEYIASNADATAEEIAQLKSEATAQAGKTYTIAVANFDYDTAEQTTTLESLVTIEGGKYAAINTLVYEGAYGASFDYKVSSLNGINMASDGKWYYYQNGIVDTSFTGLAYYKNNNAWYYFTNGELDKTYLGLFYFNNSWWYIKNGTIAKTYTGLVYYEKDWWYVTNGKLDKSYKGVTTMNGSIWFVKDGKIARTTSGVWEQDGNIYWIVNGKVDTSVYDLKYHNGEWYYFRAGVVDWTYNDLAYANNAWWYVKNGKLDKTYTGLFLFRGKLWYINAGKLDKTYVGTVTYNGHTYSVKDGVGTLIK